MRADVNKDFTPTLNLNLYDWGKQIDVTILYEELLQVAYDLGEQPNLVSYCRRQDEFKVFDVTEKTFHKRFEAGLNDLKVLDISRLKYPKKTDYNYPAFTIGADSDIDDNIARHHLYLSYEPQNSTIDPTYFNRLINRLWKYIQPTYGIGYFIEQRFVPSHYACGFINGRLPEIEKQRIAEWGSYHPDTRVPKEGKLRDVYELNYLSKVHLDRPVSSESGKSALRDWIIDNDAGTLTPINDVLTLWQINLKHRNEIRQILLDSDSLVVTV